MPTSKSKIKGKNTASNGVRSARLYKSNARSRVTNGASLLPNVDGRTFWVRRYRDLNSLLLSDQGGEENASEARRMLVRRAACLAVELERREAVIAEAGEATDNQLEVYGRTSNTLRRLLESLGLERRARDITPSLDQYIAQNYPHESEEESDG
ncbi:hypothetical protein V4R08_05085 [Nitrobacter sp. NHB1]|uniref:hypothetical protein n=1 Tax=Nitrobacter sp. NHB1 TaxID=3119830 RepID=UPI0030001D44